ncbi:Probable E3 ubiquitin-protein ligase HERC2 [Sergentomyia squamirostris]
MSFRGNLWAPLPCLDVKWLNVDLLGTLRSAEDTAVLYNHLLQDNELTLTAFKGVENDAGNMAYLSDVGKFFCGVDKTSCTCCPGYCLANTCGCNSCQRLSADAAGTAAKKYCMENQLTTQFTSENLIESWLWDSIPSRECQATVRRSLLNEQREISLHAAGSCLSAIHLRQRLLIYHRYFIALSRAKPPIRIDAKTPKNEMKLQSFSSVDSTRLEIDRNILGMGLARVGTRAALNFSFAFLRRAWRSGEDTELCSELLTEALESLHGLPEASLFNSGEISSLWIEVLERSIKFLRQVVLGDIMGTRCNVPREDRHTALNLLLELGIQKGNLGSVLEGVLLLLNLWEKDKDGEDNRTLPKSPGAPLVHILRRFERINQSYGSHIIGENNATNPTESFLRFLSLPESDTELIDLKQAAVVIISHLDRLAKPHLASGNFAAKASFSSASSQAQQVFTLGWLSLNCENYGYSRDLCVNQGTYVMGQQYTAATLDLPMELSIAQVVCSEGTIHILTTKGELFAINATSASETVNAQLVEGFGTVPVMKVASHSEGCHYLALNAEQQVYSWGSGEHGRLGHGDIQPREIPTRIAFFTDKPIISVHCGTSYSAAIGVNGELYTWGCGAYRRLGHETSDDKLVPTVVNFFLGQRVRDVALGTGDAHTLCVTEVGSVYAWGDGEYGKLGTGSNYDCDKPTLVEGISKVARIFSGAQFSVALTEDGILYSWGNGNGGRLGHSKGTPHVNTPRLVDGLQGRVVCDVAVGSAHCLALTTSGEVYGWGSNDYQQVCPTSICRDPIIGVPILTTLPSMRLSGMACGAAYTIVWCHSSLLGLSMRIPFVVDLTEHTFRLLDQLLGIVIGATNSSELRFPPNQEAECVAVACLNLLRLQLNAVIVNNISPKSVGLGEGSRLLGSLKTRILSLAGGPVILKTIQDAAQATLQIGWSVLLPTASERAQTLTSLLPSGVDNNISTCGHRFMTDLLVGSLMAEGGLQTALNQVINCEPEDTSNSHNLPLLHLIKQLLRNNSALTQARLNQLLLGQYSKTYEETTVSFIDQPSPSLDLLHRFQRLLLSRIHRSKLEDIQGAEGLLGKYLYNVVKFSLATIHKAHEVALQKTEGVAEILKSDISDTLLYELLIGLVLIHKDCPVILTSFEWIKVFTPLLTALDNVNRLICENEIQNADDMGWPAILCRGTQKQMAAAPPEESNIIRKSDLENHNLSGGQWIVMNGFVYNIEGYECENSNTTECLRQGVGKDMTNEMNLVQHRTALEHITNHFRVGKFGLSDCSERIPQHRVPYITHFSSQRTLAYLLGLRSGLLQMGILQQPAEIHCKTLLNSIILSGGLQVLQPSNPFDEEKGEARSSASTAGSTPTESSNHIPMQEMPELNCWPLSRINQRVDSLLTGLGESRLTDPLVSTWITISERYCKENNLIWHQDYPPEHPIQEFERLLTAVLFRHQSLGPLVLAVVDCELSGVTLGKPPKPIADIIKIVNQTKWALIRTRQQLNRSYKEVCAPILDKCRFLLYEVRPAVSPEQSALNRLCILHKEPRFKSVVRRIINEMRIAKKQLECAKPEDILNVTIQSQHTAIKINSPDFVEKGSIENLDAATLSPEKNVSCENLADMAEDLRSEKKTSNVDEAKTPTNENNTNFMRRKEDFESAEQFINNVIAKLSEKSIQNTKANPGSENVISQIVDFVTQDICDVETLRRAMFCQVQRYQVRKQGLEMFSEILKHTELLDAVQYNMLNGYLGLFLSKPEQVFYGNVLDDVNLITAYQKADLILTHAKIMEWAIGEIQKFVNQEQIYGKQKHHGDKDNSNLGTYVFLKKLSRARFLLSVFGIMAKDLGANELSFLINSGALGCILGLLRQMGGDVTTVKCGSELSVVYEDTILKQKTSRANLTGPEMAKLMKIGTRIVRGTDWKWGDQDGPTPGEGRIISELGEDGWVRVEWDTGATNSYRMGKEGQYDLRLADSLSNIVSPDSDAEEEDLLNEIILNGDSHPTKLLRHSCIKMLQIFSVGVGQYGDRMQKSAVFGLASMFRAVLSTKIGFQSFGFEQWTTLGFLRAISSSRELAKYLTSEPWLNLHIDILDSANEKETDIYRKIQSLRLLQATLVNWTTSSQDRMMPLIRKLLTSLGRTIVLCSNDSSLIQNPADLKSRVLVSASYSGTIAEEVIFLLRKLHSVPAWNGTINEFLSEKLCIAADLFTQDSMEDDIDDEKIHIVGALSVIGGYDPRSRLGSHINVYGNLGTVTRFTSKGKAVVSLHATGEIKKLSMTNVKESLEVLPFNFARLPTNEMLVNSWAMLLYGPGDRRYTASGKIDICLLRSQQVQLASLSATGVLFKHQCTLRKILKQRTCGLSRCSSDDSLSDEGNDQNSSGGDHQDTEQDKPEDELLIQNILMRATQPSPVKACYSYNELYLAALSISQMLASNIHAQMTGSSMLKNFPLPVQTTLIHGVPVYNDSPMEDSTLARKNPPSALVQQIMEMGLSRRAIEYAISQLTTKSEIPPTADQVVLWLFEHDAAVNASVNEGATSMDYLAINNESDTESAISDTPDWSSTTQDAPIKYCLREDFKTSDQYAIYVRGHVCPGMTVRCIKDFEEIRIGDIGTVLKVDTEGLHDLNVQVDWRMHGSAYWMCFLHLELISPPQPKDPITPAHSTPSTPQQMTIGSNVSLKRSITVSYARTKSKVLPKGTVGTVWAINGREVSVEFPGNFQWTGFVSDLELTASEPVQHTLFTNNEEELTDDWSKCIKSLTVSSNENTAKHLLDRSSNCWQSSGPQGGKHWIRLEMHEKMLIHSLAITVSSADHSHMPSLVVVRVGDSVATLKDLSWVSVKVTDTIVPLLTGVKLFYPFVEIVVKQCRNNGIQCKVHAINIIGHKQQTDLDLMLLNASFLASEYDIVTGENSPNTFTNQPDDKSCRDQFQCKVLVWGLNDKEQLGGLKGSKVKVPTFSPALSQLNPIHISGGSKSLFVVSQDGKVYACGEGTNGRLGLGHNCNVSTPRQIPVLSQYVVKKVAVHSGGKHALALTLDGKVFSFGEGEDGKLGHGNRLTLDKPKLIEALRSKRIRDVACGSSHSAAITSSGELYTWGLGEYGRLGHGDNSTQLKPKLVSALLGHRVVQVACGSRDAQTLALTEEGLVFSWGDGDFGKLGRGGSEGCSLPQQVERLNGVGVIQIECGAQFSLALTTNGEVWTWGKGDYFRLGHGTDQHVRKPTPIQGLRGKKVIHVAVGALHCLAVTDTGQVFAWGDNDHGQQGSGNTTVNKKPYSVVGLEGVFVNRVACGSSHSVAWCLPQSPAEEDKKEPIAFSVNKDALGSNSLGIYDSESQTSATGSSKSQPRKSLSEIVLSIESLGARQMALNYILNSMSILQARQAIIAALTSHSQANTVSTEKSLMESCEEATKEIVESQLVPAAVQESVIEQETIAHGGGEAPAELANAPDVSPDADLILANMNLQSGPLSAFQTLTGSMSQSGSISSCNATQKHSKMSASAMSVMAATMTHQDEMVHEANVLELDDITCLLGEFEAKSLVELLKLSVAGRCGGAYTSETIASTLITLGANSPVTGSMLLETCITELEDLCTSRHCLGKIPKPVVQETCHPYVDDVTLVGHVKIPGAEALRIEFDSQCSTEKRNDPLVIMDGFCRVVATRSGREYAQWAPEIRIPGDEMRWKFISDSSVNGWGWRFWVHAIMPSSFLQELCSDRAVLSQPSMDLVMALLDSRICVQISGVFLRLIAALAACAQLSTLTSVQRIWALKKLHAVLTSKSAQKSFQEHAISSILTPLIPGLLRQYEYEEPQVRGGIHLMHSEYFKTLAELACDMQLDGALPQGDSHKWSWFRRYCTAVRVAQSLIKRTTMPQQFCLEIRKKLAEMNPNPPSGASTSLLSVSSASSLSGSVNIQYIDSISPTPPPAPVDIEKSLSIGGPEQYLHEEHSIFKPQHDSQLLQWLNRRPEDWALSWGGASTIYGWGHNHRGQLGGLEGGRIKTPTPCEALSLLRPVQLAGGEQTLYAVTADGKLFATGYGAGGRLGIGGSESVSTPTLVESLQHVFVKKVAVNSGGKHCLALTSDGEVYSWGEGEDGKLGHGNRLSYDRPKLIEALSGVGVVDIACGSAHSACITSQGLVLTWGKGRYGRLGLGDSEDQTRPKMVEALLGYRAIDIACGSGDAQTLCITDDDNVWSWGDGDYGKLGRGGSDGCKVPTKIESLAGLGVIKVECGSQFSVALTRSGAVYTWGKGDYHRLGHGSVDHVRRPKKIATLQGKKIISIATGSLHCVACSDQGEVFTWGDNDEGQLGDGTVSAIPRPRLVTALQGKHIVKVTCGSAHTLALSTSQLNEGCRPPPLPPLEYDLCRDLPPDALHARLVLLHHFSELICPCLAMLPISGELSLSSLKDLLVYSIKEAAFRKVIQTTMVRDKQHGPVIELNRIQVKRSRVKSGGGLAGVDGMKSVFGQMVHKLPLLTQEALSLPHRVWKVKFVGESVDDCGGGYSESIAEMCDELQNGSVPLLIQTPNGRGEAGANRDCFLLDPTLTTVLQMNMFRFLGVLMGVAVRTGSPLSLNLAEPVWRQLSGEVLRPADLTEIDRDYVAGLLCIRDMDDDPKVFDTLELPFATPSAKGHEISLSTKFNKITPQNRHEYIKLALNYRLHEFDEQVKAVRDGMSKVIPVPLLSLFSAAELQAMVCGSPDIPLGLLKSVASYKGVEPTSNLVMWFWEVMEEFTNQERSLFLRFVWGRTRLPRTIADFRGRDFVLQVLDKYNPPDHFLPESYTCFFLLKMPRYTCKAVLQEKLKYAIHFCKSIDSDEYARVAIGEPTETTGSEDSDIESVASHNFFN